MPRYRIRDVDEVFDRVALTSESCRREFYDRLSELVENPYPGDGDVLEYKDRSRPNSFTASFGDGILVYQVLKDHPVLFLWDVFLYEASG